MAELGGAFGVRWLVSGALARLGRETVLRGCRLRSGNRDGWWAWLGPEPDPLCVGGGRHEGA